MSSITQTDLKLGGRLTAACDAVAENKLRTAAGIFMEIAGELNLEAEQSTGLLAADDDWSVTVPAPVNPYATAENLQMCARNVHNFGAIDARGWATCAVCGMVNTQPRPGGPIDLTMR